MCILQRVSSPGHTGIVRRDVEGALLFPSSGAGSPGVDEVGHASLHTADLLLGELRPRAFTRACLECPLVAVDQEAL